jgi:hypothetical protein
MLAGTSSFTRVFGDQAVLSRLERLGRNPRIFPNLVRVGFFPDQLALASQWFAQGAATPVDRYASQQMARGFFEDESLLKLFCAYFECTDWKLEQSGWFFSQEDYQRFFSALVNPVEFHIAQLEQGQGEERWGGYFLKLPFDLGMNQARRSLWEEIIHQEYYWKPLETYTHLRAATLFAYLQRTVDILNFSTVRFNYHWERTFREQFHAALRRFEEKLEESARHWQEHRRENARQRFHYRSYRRAEPYQGIILQSDLLEAFSVLGLDRFTATLGGVRKAFRKLSKGAHPDHGGTPEAFRRLSRSKEMAEAWLRRIKPSAE